MSDAATLEGHTLLASGKVREIYDEGGRLLMVASDRISTYDVIHPTPIPGKGAVLTGISAFWFDRTGQDRKSTRLNSSHLTQSRMPSSA